LVFRAKPADVAGFFLGGAFVVEGDQAGEERLGESVGVRSGTRETVGEGERMKVEG
jgi:hypothetical protein